MSVSYDGGSLGSAPLLSGFDRPHRKITYFNDCFVDLTSDGFTLTELNDAGDSEFAATETLTDAKGGVVKIDVATGGDSAHDGAQVGSAEMFKCDKDLYYETRVKFANAGFAFIGLSAGADDGAILSASSALNNNDMLGFYLDGTTATNASMDFYSRKDGSNSTVSGVATVGTDFIRLGFSVKAGIVTVWVDGEKMGTVESNIPSDEELGIVWAITSDGTDGVPTLEIDYAVASMDR